jgi:hypothetical protein
VKRLLAFAVFIVITAVVVSASHGPLKQPASKVLVLKIHHKLLLLDDSNNVLRSYPEQQEQRAG